MLYSDKVMDHFEHPRNVGEIADADGVGQVGNPKCGDIMKMYLKIDGDVITDVKFKTFGCGSAIATSSMATEPPVAITAPLASRPHTQASSTRAKPSAPSSSTICCNGRPAFR